SAACRYGLPLSTCSWSGKPRRWMAARSTSWPARVFWSVTQRLCTRSLLKSSTSILWNQKSTGLSTSVINSPLCGTVVQRTIKRGERDKARLNQLSRGRTSRGWYVGEAFQQVVDSSGSFSDRRSLVVCQSDFGQHPLQVALRF